MSLCQLLLCLLFYKSQLSTSVKAPTPFVIQPPFRRQEFEPPKRSISYNPSHGFEPYWPDGGWVFDRLEVTTEKPEGTVCGNECIDMYKEFGEICGRNRYYERKTFKNYCELLDYDCLGREKWMIVYRGVCVSKLKLYPTAQTQLLTRASDYDYVFQSINPDKYDARTFATNATSSTTKIRFVNVRVQCGLADNLPLGLPPQMLNFFGGGQKTTARIYNPHYGYEPYWDNGDWVFRDPKLPPGVTTTSVPLVCGEECLEIYTPIGEVCGRQASNLVYDGCTPNVISWFCSGVSFDDQSKGYETFATYCKFLDRQCRVEFEERWIFIHPGPCVKPQLNVYRPFSISDLPINRMTLYISSLAQFFDNNSIDHTIFGTRY